MTVLISSKATKECYILKQGRILHYDLAYNVTFKTYPVSREFINIYVFIIRCCRTDWVIYSGNTTDVHTT